MAQIRAGVSGVVTVDGMVVSVREGDKYDTGDDVVREFPWMFESPVEEATANPGQRRSTSRA